MDDLNIFSNIGVNTRNRTVPVQTLPDSKKNDEWVKATLDTFYWEATQQIKRNSVFSEIRKMTEGEYTYKAVTVEETLTDSKMKSDFANLNKDFYTPTHIKHFDFIGIIANAIKGMFSELDDLYRVQSNDEYFTNEYIRLRTEKLHQYAQKVFKAEIDKMLIAKGLNPNKQDFQSEEEKQQYLQQLDAEVKKYTPEEIEKELSTNFKVVATEWANNVLISDRDKFSLDKEDKKALTDYILTGRWFRHYKVGYDYYDVEYWRPEETFFSQDVDSEYPQDSDFIGRLTEMSSNKILQKYGHLMTTKQQERIGDYWNQKDDYKKGNGLVGSALSPSPFAEAHILPFENYYDHQINLQMETALGAPLAQSMDKNTGEVTRHWMPRSDYSILSPGKNFTRNLRTDIDVRTDTIEVLDVYWRSMKRIGIVIFKNDTGVTQIEIVQDKLLREFIEQHEISIKRNLSLQELQDALRNDRIEEYSNTLTYHYIPEIWHAVVLKGSNASILTEDMILDAKPLDYQIKGDSNLFQVRIPVGGLISKGIVPKLLPYQQLHNVCLNQVTELLGDELGVFYTFDVNALPAEYKDETTQEALYAMADTIKLTKLAPVDLSRTNTQGSSVYPNVFQRNEVVFVQQVQYRREMAAYYKQEAFQQVGITPQMLGAPTNYETAEGVKQQASATYGLISNIIDEFNTSKAKANELHIAIAQYCEVNGKTTTRVIQKSDASNHFIDILAEDPDYFPLRRLNILPASNSKDRSVVKGIQQILMSDNTIQKDIGDVIDILTNPYISELKQIGRDIRKRSQMQAQEQRAFEDSQLTKQLEDGQAKLAADRQHEIAIVDRKGEWSYKEAYINALGKDSMSTKTDDTAEIEKAYKAETDSYKMSQDYEIKNRELNRKETADMDSKEIALKQINQKNEELRLRQEQMNTQKYVAQINKN